MNVRWVSLLATSLPLLGAWWIGTSLWWGLVVGGVVHGVLALGLLYPRSSFLCPTIWRGPQVYERVVALTFDDGPHPVITPRVLRVLEEHDVYATFFVIGRHVAAQPEIVRDLVAAGHEIGNHTYRHTRHPYLLSRRQLIGEMQRTQVEIERAAGTVPGLFRPPIGFRSFVMASAARSAGLKLVNFSVSARDTRRISAARITKRILRSVHPGAIILLHDGIDRPDPAADRTETLEALPHIIAALKTRGYRLVRLSELLSEVE